MKPDPARTRPGTLRPNPTAHLAGGGEVPPCPRPPISRRPRPRRRARGRRCVAVAVRACRRRRQPPTPTPPPSRTWDRLAQLRVRRQLAHQHRQRLLRRAAVLPTPPGDAYHGRHFARRADKARKVEQIAIAERVLRRAGLGRLAGLLDQAGPRPQGASPGLAGRQVARTARATARASGTVGFLGAGGTDCRWPRLALLGARAADSPLSARRPQESARRGRPSRRPRCARAQPQGRLARPARATR